MAVQTVENTRPFAGLRAHQPELNGQDSSHAFGISVDRDFECPLPQLSPRPSRLESRLA